MSQILTAKFSKSALIQDIIFSKKKYLMYSSANSARCYACGKGLEDGYAIIAKSIPIGTAFFCEVHYDRK